MNRAVFLDRDGVINRRAQKGGYIIRWQDWQFLPGVSEAIRLLNEADFRVVVVTNQRCVAKGLLTLRALRMLHRRMIEELVLAGARIDAVYFCPHEKRPSCICRKPAPGLLLKAAKAHQIELKSSWMIGDSSSDIAAGRNAGCKTVRILYSKSDNRPAADISANSLLEAVRRILSRQNQRRNKRRKRQER